MRDGFLPFLVSFFDTFQKRYSTFLPVSLLFAGSYALENIEKWSDAETEEFAAILAEQDPDVYQYLTKKKEPEEPRLANSKMLKDLQVWAMSNPLKYEAKW